MSKFLFDSMLPKYPQFQPFISSHISSQSSTLTTSTSEGSPLTSSEGSPTSPPSSKMYPYVSNHPSSHSSLSGMPGFSGLEDKSCRYVNMYVNKSKNYYRSNKVFLTNENLIHKFRIRISAYKYFAFVLTLLSAMIVLLYRRPSVHFIFFSSKYPYVYQHGVILTHIMV